MIISKKSCSEFGKLLFAGVSPNNETPGVDNNQVKSPRDAKAVIFWDVLSGDKTPAESFEQLRWIQGRELTEIINQIETNFTKVINKQLDYLIETAILKMTKPRGAGDPKLVRDADMPWMLWLFLGRKQPQAQPRQGLTTGFAKMTGAQLADKRDDMMTKATYIEAVLDSFEDTGAFRGRNREFSIDPRPFEPKAIRKRLMERRLMRVNAEKAAEKAGQQEGRLHESYRRKRDEEIYNRLMKRLLK